MEIIRCVKVYDSIGNSISNKVSKILCILYPLKSSIICETVMKQPDMYSCRVFSFVFTASLIFGQNPFNEHYIIDGSNICKTWTLRNHLRDILINKLLLPFPTVITIDASVTHREEHDTPTVKCFKTIKLKIVLKYKSHKTITNKIAKATKQCKEISTVRKNEEMFAFNYLTNIDYVNNTEVKTGLMNKTCHFCYILKWSE